PLLATAHGHPRLRQTARQTPIGQNENCCLLALHLPGVLVRRDVDTGKELVTEIRDDTLYHCREKKGS
ncbi:MAG TPA: hypothetical protein VKT99_19895, partial [Xanthobacteraceae bacterium]|nr:hypothetical protein [Xanthobacteraceae bacterium]